MSDLDPALAEYLLGGDLRAALDDLKAREQPRLVLWLKHELARLWQTHRVELEAEAARRGIKAWWPQREAEWQRAFPRADPKDNPFSRRRIAAA